MIEVFKQALEALKDVGVLTDREWQAVHKNKANELRQAIAELESQERNFCPRCGKRTNDIHTCTPPQRTWVGLTDGEMEDTLIQCGGRWNGDYWEIEDADFHPFLRTIEAKLKERNDHSI